MLGMSIFAIASPFSGWRRITRWGGSWKAFSRWACCLFATNAETGSCQSRVTPASAMSRVPLTIITDAANRSTARIGAV